MKIAVPTIGGILDEYFNSCEVFTIFTVDESNHIIDSEILYTPEGCDCRNNIPLVLQGKGVSAVLAYKMPEHAEGVCSKYGIEMYLGYSGEVRKAAETFLEKEKSLP